VGNALAYGDPHHAVTVDVASDDREATLAVNNQGVPISADFLKVMFEPFRRDVPRHDRSPHGLGLGLYIVHQIVRAHHGDVRVESNAEKGTTFTICLPRAEPVTREARRA
jgi:signal transduction histidine kinase